jgi:mxaA protein
VTDPRPFGHFTGDVIERRVAITVDAKDELIVASLPSPGQVAYWLDLNRLEVKETKGGGERTYRLRLVYQTFYVPLETKRVTLPAITVKFKTAEGPSTATLAPFGLTMSPIRELIPEKSDGATAFALRPDAGAERVATERTRFALIASAAAAALSFLLLAHHRAWGPFRKRPGRPFTEAARDIRLSAGENGAAAGYRKGLLALHRAFDETSGRRVLAEDIDGFLSRHPRLGEDRDGITRFFASSRQAFFGDDMSASIATLPPSELQTLAKRLARIERSSET